MGKIPNGLREWLSEVEKLGELQKVSGASWQEEIGMASELVCTTENAPAVIFDQVPGFPSDYRVLVNCFGSMERLGLTVGLPEGATREKLMYWRKRIGEIESMPFEEVKDGPVLENILTGDEVDVLKFPTPKWHELDGGRYIGTGSSDITKDPDTGQINLGTYRVMIQDKNHVGFYISPGKHGRVQREKYFAKGEPCPVAIVCGMDPLLLIASCTELNPVMNEYEWVGGLRGEPVKVVRGKVTGLPIPADAEIVLEGFAYPDQLMDEGPFGEWTGYYASSHRMEPVLDVKAIYHRNDPILVGMPPNRPPDEIARFRSFLRSALMWEQLENAGIVDVNGVWCHEVGGTRLFNVISINQRYPGHARQAGHVAAMCHAGAYIGRYTIVVDGDIDPANLNEVMWAVCTRSDPATSNDLIQRAWSGPLDPAIRPELKGFSSRVIIDACRPFEWLDKFPMVNQASPERKQQGLDKFGYLLR